MPLLSVLFWFGVLVVALYALLKSADFFVDTAEVFGKKLKIPSFIVGATVVAFGTSLPELAVGIASVLKGQPGIVAGTVIGSNISNIFLIGGIAILMSAGFLVSFKKHIVAFAYLVGTAFLFAYFLNDLRIGLIEGVISVILLASYVAYIVLYPHEEEDEGDEEEAEKLGPKTILLFIASGIGIWAGAEFTILSILKISSSLNLGSDVISQTVVALGTSLPELAVTIVAVRKLRFNMVLGNIIGSNIFNTLCVIGIPALIGYLFVGSDAFLLKDSLFHQFTTPIMLLATTMLLLLGIIKKTPRFFGILFVLLYVFYIAGSFGKFNLLALIP